MRKRATEKDGEVTVRRATPEEMRRFKNRVRGRSGIKQQRCIGDTAPMFGKDVVAFRGGEGGRNWAINATIV